MFASLATAGANDLYFTSCVLFCSVLFCCSVCVVAYCHSFTSLHFRTDFSTTLKGTRGDMVRWPWGKQDSLFAVWKISPKLYNKTSFTVLYSAFLWFFPLVQEPLSIVFLLFVCSAVSLSPYVFRFIVILCFSNVYKNI